MKKTPQLPAGLEDLRVVDEKVVSALTGLALQSLRNRRSRGLGPPHFKIGGACRYRVSEVLRWMESCRAELRQ